MPTGQKHLFILYIAGINFPLRRRKPLKNVDADGSMVDKAIFGGTRKEEARLIIAVCIDARGGMLFNHRRQSQDRAQREDLLDFCAGRRLWIAPYSAPLFREREDVRADEKFLDKAAEGEVCFVEDRPVAPLSDRIESMVVYDWDRAYPADVHLDLDPASSGFALKEEREFPGSSHEKIIRRVYERGEDCGPEEQKSPAVDG